MCLSTGEHLNALGYENKYLKICKSVLEQNFAVNGIYMAKQTALRITGPVSLVLPDSRALYTQGSCLTDMPVSCPAMLETFTGRITP